MKIRVREYIAAYTYLSPAVLIVGGFIFYPLIYNLWLSLTKVPLGPAENPLFVGFKNYASLFGSPQFGKAFLDSFIFTIGTVFGCIILGLAVALVLNEEFAGKKTARVFALLPYGAPIIGAAMVWKFMLHPTFGVVNYLFVDIIPLLKTPINWTDAPEFAMPAVIVFDTWRYFPFAYLFSLAGLQRIPKMYYEAAKVDGASVWRRFISITLPEMRYILATLFLIRWIWNFNKFADIYLLSTSVEVMPVFLYQKGFQAFNLGLAAAVSTILFILLLLFAVPFIRRVLEL